MGVAGVAVATVGSQAISAVICILVMFRDVYKRQHWLQQVYAHRSGTSFSINGVIWLDRKSVV